MHRKGKSISLNRDGSTLLMFFSLLLVRPNVYLASTESFGDLLMWSFSEEWLLVSITTTSLDLSLSCLRSRSLLDVFLESFFNKLYYFFGKSDTTIKLYPSSYKNANDFSSWFEGQSTSFLSLGSEDFEAHGLFLSVFSFAIDSIHLVSIIS